MDTFGAIRIDGRARWSVDDRAVASRIGDEVAILDFNTDHYFTLNATGAAIWDRLQSPATIEEVAGHLSDRFDVAHDRAMLDVAALVRHLVEARLVMRIDDGRER